LTSIILSSTTFSRSRSPTSLSKSETIVFGSECIAVGCDVKDTADSDSKIVILTRKVEQQDDEIKRLRQLVQSQARLFEEKTQTLRGLLAEFKVQYTELKDKYDYQIAKTMWIDNAELLEPRQEMRKTKSAPSPSLNHNHYDQELQIVADLEMHKEKVDALRKQLHAVESENEELRHCNFVLTQQIEESNHEIDTLRMDSTNLAQQLEERDSSLREMQQIRDLQHGEQPSIRTLVTPSFNIDDLQNMSFDEGSDDAGTPRSPLLRIHNRRLSEFQFNFSVQNHEHRRRRSSSDLNGIIT